MSVPDKPVTLQTIADRAGVTRALVSMALRNSSKVAKKTREKIQTLARELGYRPNPMVRALMTSVRQGRATTYRATLAFITCYQTRDIWRTWRTYPEYLQGATERGQELGYQLEHFWLGDYAKEPSRLVRVLRARGIAGVIVPPLLEGKHSLNIDLSGFSVVALGYTLQSPNNVPRVCNHHVRTMEEALEQLAARGYKRVGIAIQDRDARRVNYLWSAGVATMQKKLPTLKISQFEPREWTQDAFCKWFGKNRPEIVIGVTLEVWNWTRDLGLPIPGKLGFLHLDCRHDDELSGMHQNTLRLGRAAMEIVASLVEGNIRCDEEESRITMIGSEFNPGTTLRPVNEMA